MWTTTKQFRFTIYCTVIPYDTRGPMKLQKTNKQKKNRQR